MRKFILALSLLSFCTMSLRAQSTNRSDTIAPSPPAESNSTATPPAAATHSSLQNSETEKTLALKEKTEKWTARDIAFIISPLISLIGVGFIIYFTRRNTISEQWLKTNESEAAYLQNKLDNFYGPFSILSEANHLLAQDLRSRQPNPGAYRLLEKLFDENWRNALTPGDQILIKEISTTGIALSEIITKNSGLVDSRILPYISRAIAHFKILKLAYDRELGSNSAPFLRYVYPRSLDGVINKELKRLQDRLTLLRRNPTIPHGNLEPLDLNEFSLDEWPNPQRPAYDPKTNSLISADNPKEASAS